MCIRDSINAEYGELAPCDMLCCGDDPEPSPSCHGVAQYYLKTGDKLEWVQARVRLDDTSIVVTLPGSNVLLPLGPEHQVFHQLSDDLEEIKGTMPTPFRFVVWPEGDRKADRSHIFCVHSEAEAVRWVGCLRQVLCTLRRPVWKPDQEHQECAGCHRGFTLFRRRHHCRRCGWLFCSKCGSEYDLIPGMGYSRRVRMCGGCLKLCREEAGPPGQKTYLDWVRQKFVEERVLPSPRRQSELGLGGFATIRDDRWRSSSTVFGSSVDSTAANVVIKAAGKCHGGSVDVRTTFTMSETWSETDDAVRDVLAAADEVQSQLHARQSHVTGA
eukprot:TRINITY_DN54498_c0_g1_i2.p1 TRINITY_DN54498_c0_g1~~TRINITY_DN54498_c0_g1_i2.p1  ORF type:complete len:343 (-),score=47.42 TRINITY_DN54498_c0_g1_i2:187-1170(-)